MLQFFAFQQTDSSEQEEKVKLCFNKTLLHSTSVTKY